MVGRGRRARSGVAFRPRPGTRCVGTPPHEPRISRRHFDRGLRGWARIRVLASSVVHGYKACSPDIGTFHEPSRRFVDLQALTTFGFMAPWRANSLGVEAPHEPARSAGCQPAVSPTSSRQVFESSGAPGPEGGSQVGNPISPGFESDLFGPRAAGEAIAAVILCGTCFPHFDRLGG